MPPSILIVDDDPLLVQLIGSMVYDLGRVRFATSGTSALQLLAHERPDVILLDAEMPDMKGADVCRTVRSSSDMADISIIFVTAHTDEEFEVECLEAGAADFIHKPVRRSVLRARVQTQLRLKQARETIRRMAMSDPLTGLFNRRAFDGFLSREGKQALRDGKPLGLLIVDVDRFKEYNDTYGHPAGDACLASVAHALQDALLRPHDLIARYGGEEFVVLLPDATHEGVRVVAERLMQSVLSLRIPHRYGVDGEIVSVSLGGAVLEPRSLQGGAADNPASHHQLVDSGVRSLVERADEALYTAKRQGRARFSMTEPIHVSMSPGSRSVGENDAPSRPAPS